MSDTDLEDAFRQICASEMPLGERLDAFSHALKRFSLPFANVYDDLVIGADSRAVELSDSAVED